MSKAFVTLLTDDHFLPGLEVLLYTIRKHSNLDIPIVVLVTPNVTKTTHMVLKRSIRTFSRLIQRPFGMNVIIETVQHIPCPQGTSHVEGWVNSGYTKLRVWDLNFDRVVYLDADTVLVDCIDELFLLQVQGGPGSFAAAPDVFPPDKFNAGVLVVNPDTNTFQKMVDQIDTLPSHDGGDTGFLNSWSPMVSKSDWYRRLLKFF